MRQRAQLRHHSHQTRILALDADFLADFDGGRGMVCEAEALLFAAGVSFFSSLLSL